MRPAAAELPASAGFRGVWRCRAHRSATVHPVQAAWVWHWRRTGRPNATRGIAEQIVVSDWMSRGVLLQVVPLAVMLNS